MKLSVILYFTMTMLLFLGCIHRENQYFEKKNTHNWSETDIQKLHVALIDIIEQSNDKRTKKISKELVDCILVRAIEEYPEIEALKSLVVDEPDILTPLIVPCLKKYDLLY